MTAGDVALVEARTPAQVAQARRLIAEYGASTGIDLSFQDFEQELADLPKRYPWPRGRILLANISGRTIGCVALRPLNQHDAELKRLYIQPNFRGRGIGQRLCEAVIDIAWKVGYERILLDTLPEMTSAQRLYGMLGFVETTSYVFNPVPDTRFLELVRPLRSSAF